ncbi:FAD-binding oxidoreductase [Sphingomonas sp. CL5.1]|nr:FAD-binding oxidoreductase [Sphingomonas sp. CL5.1]
MALHLVENGRPPLLLEGAAIGSGATGMSAGIVAPQLVRATPSAVLAKFGVPRGEALLRLVSDSGRYLFDLATRHAIDCDQSAAGFLAPATGHGALQRLGELIGRWRPYRSDLALCGAAEVEALSGCRGYGAAILHQTGGSIDPLLYARGLAARAEALGARIHEDTHVTAITREGRSWIVSTGAARVRAQQVVLAANGGNGALHPALTGTVLPLPVCEMSTEPLPPEMRAAILPFGHSLTDMEADVFSIRYTAGDRLVTAHPMSSRHSIGQIAEAVNRRLAATLVAYRPLRLEHVWHGTAWVNSNLLPRLVRPAEGVIAIQACNGRGLGINTIIGREVARTLLDPGSSPDIGFETPRRISGFAFARHVPHLLMTAALASKAVRNLFTR